MYEPFCYVRLSGHDDALLLLRSFWLYIFCRPAASELICSVPAWNQ